MTNWWSREAQRQRDLAAGVDADLKPANQRRFRLPFVLIGTVALLAAICRVLHLSEWKETTSLLPNQMPELKPGQQAQIVSYLGTYDREVS